MLYTGQGDAGFTSIIGAAALPKCHVRLEALGALDEAQAHLGVARALLAGSPWAASLCRVEADLRLLMADIATIPHGQAACGYLTDEHLSRLEGDLDAWDVLTGGFTGLVLPGASLAEAHLQLARAIVRRAERQVVALAQDQGPVHPLMLTYLNRLSSWVFALALLVNQPAHHPDAGVAA